jgi:hypothetical protein
MTAAAATATCTDGFWPFEDVANVMAMLVVTVGEV